MRRVRVLVVLVSMALVLSVMPAGLAQLPDSMPGDRIYGFEGVIPISTQLFTVGVHGQNRQALTSGEGLDLPHAWSPDGTRVVFRRSFPEPEGLWVVNADGTGEEFLGHDGATPNWSPDGRYVVFTSGTVVDPGGVRIVEVDTGESWLVPGTEHANRAVWSPAGNRIAYSWIEFPEEGEPPPDNEGTATVRPDGTDRRVLDDEAWPLFNWSPDGSHLVYVDALEAEQGSVRVARADGTDVWEVAQGYWLGHPAWSPDGSQIVWSEREGPEFGSFNLHAVAPDGTGHRQITDTGEDDRGGAWSASGRWVAFTRHDDIFALQGPADIWVVDMADPDTPAHPVTDSQEGHATDFAPGMGLRIFGENRVATAAELSRTQGGTGAVVVARADDYADGLVGGPLAAAVDGPVLLSGRDSLSPRTAEEVSRRGASVAYLLGGEAALSQQIEDDLRALGVDDVVRFAGTNRFDTARLVADALAGEDGDTATAYVVEGRNPDPGRGWPDAVSVSGLAAFEARPILLVEHGHLPVATIQALDDHETDEAVIVGGSAAVSPDVEAEIADRGIATDRLEGANRYATSVAVADRADDAGMTRARPWVVTGRNWPDGLAAGPAAAADAGILLLVDGDNPAGSPESHAWLAAGCCTDRFVLVGGTAAVRPPVAAALEVIAAD